MHASGDEAGTCPTRVPWPGFVTSPQLLVLGYWVGVRHLFHLSLFLTASRMDLPQGPSTDPKCLPQALEESYEARFGATDRSATKRTGAQPARAADRRDDDRDRERGREPERDEGMVGSGRFSDYSDECAAPPPPPPCMLSRPCRRSHRVAPCRACMPGYARGARRSDRGVSRRQFSVNFFYEFR